MSSILYGRLSRTVEDSDLRLLEENPTPAQRLAAFAQQVAALVPAEVLTVHAVVLAYSTVNDENGSTRVTHPDLLKAAFFALAATAAALYLIGRLGDTPWKQSDFFRMLLPAIAFIAWTMLTGTSAATPLFEDTDRGWLLLVGGILAALALGLAARLTPKQPPTG